MGKKHDVTEADDGVKALAAVRSVHPDLILLDIMMPGDLNGLQVLKAIRADPLIAETQVVLLTAQGESSDSVGELAKDADAYVVKPFSPAGLVALVDELLR